MVTITIQIGNSDDKLFQSEWSNYVKAVRQVIQMHASEIHFFGGSSTWKEWQNVAWIVCVAEDDIPHLKNELITIREIFNQESIAWMIGDPEFI